ncbi:hypothetical protein F8G81_21965 [Arthrobacter sp. CDRTa11]|uniref:hypothetical protein n=1 Tax=Arthrobacter sp. CDRTa11 TaxID=2651199 RepID=UPI0022659D35|nr:hypothetical protein [Arthrobacter sp. CDRTa11]UZX04966.1 hypothetical protein F8G81_21965 [Arthrobacter sp. CDRTa11]
MRRRMTFIVVAAIFIGAATGCAEPASLDLDAAQTTVEYSFRDSSVPPPYHRSYVIKASETEASITVDSYGDVLRQETAAMPAETWAKVLESAETLPRRTHNMRTPKPGCAGGTGSRIMVRDSGREQYSKSVENCGGGSDQPLRETTAPLEDLFDMNDLLKESFGEEY